MAAKLTRLTQKIAIQLQLEAKIYTIFGSRSRRPVWKRLDTPSSIVKHAVVPFRLGNPPSSSKYILGIYDQSVYFRCHSWV
jgi:hypothetical protein